MPARAGPLCGPARLGDNPGPPSGPRFLERSTAMTDLDFPLRGDFIPLDSLLKATGFASSGAQAKALVAEGGIQVDGQEELRKTAKIRAGQVVALKEGGRTRRSRVIAGEAQPD